MTDDTEIRANGRTITVTHGDRVVFPESGVTKGEIVEHYHRVAQRMLPHLRGRPVSMQRFREDIEGSPPFYQKAMPSHFPEWINRVTVPKVGGTVTHVVCDDAATLVYIANQGCITPHVWLSRIPKLELPDRLIIDLDPGDGGVRDARFAAHIARDVLTEAGLVPSPDVDGLARLPRRRAASAASRFRGGPRRRLRPRRGNGPSARPIG